MANDTLKTELPDTSAWEPDWTDSFKTQSTSPESTNVALNAVLDLVDPNVPNFCYTAIPPNVLEKNKLVSDEDWRTRFKELL